MNLIFEHTKLFVAVSDFVVAVVSFVKPSNLSLLPKNGRTLINFTGSKKYTLFISYLLKNEKEKVRSSRKRSNVPKIVQYRLLWGQDPDVTNHWVMKMKSLLYLFLQQVAELITL